ncbi:MAG: hypothetical protein NTW00_16055 [Hyphomicrobiales bacterium]|nr:hypothetical protein [Hyphomicrobiales bacterium]
MLLRLHPERTFGERMAYDYRAGRVGKAGQRVAQPLGHGFVRVRIDHQNALRCHAELSLLQRMVTQRAAGVTRQSRADLPKAMLFCADDSIKAS